MEIFFFKCASYKWRASCDVCTIPMAVKSRRVREEKKRVWKFDVHRAVHRHSISILKPTGCNNVSILFWSDTLYVSDSLSVHHQEFKTVHTAVSVWQIYSYIFCLYRARNKITQLSIPAHAQLQRHRLKFIQNHLKNSYMFRSSTIFRELQCLR